MEHKALMQLFIIKQKKKSNPSLIMSPVINLSTSNQGAQCTSSPLPCQNFKHNNRSGHASYISLNPPRPCQGPQNLPARRWWVLSSCWTAHDAQTPAGTCKWVGQYMLWWAWGSCWSMLWWAWSSCWSVLDVEFKSYIELHRATQKSHIELQRATHRAT